MYKLSTNSLNNMEGGDPRIALITKTALEISKVDFGVPKHGGLRTAEIQYDLFKRGVSKFDGVDKKSKHQTGLAIDLFAYVDGTAVWDIQYMAQVACAMLQAANTLGHKLIWGGLWNSFIDTPHFELVS